MNYMSYMSNHYRLVVETPSANLVAGMARLRGTRRVVTRPSTPLEYEGECAAWRLDTCQSGNMTLSLTLSGKGLDGGRLR